MMGRPTDPDKTREIQFNELPIAARTDIAQARNMRARMLEKREAWLEESKMFKTMVRRLKRTHGLTANKIGLLLGISRDWAVQILRDEKKGK